jgi:N-terminal double-transmembrane domain
MFENITFANPKFLWGLLMIPALIVWYVIRHKKQEASVRFSDTQGFDELPKSWRVYARHLLFALKMAALALLLVAMARPQSASTSQKSNIEGIDIILAQDISGSMLARDFKPDRLEASKKVAADFVEGRPRRRMGLVVFAGERSPKCP